jgi:hypothetical protein
MNEGGGKIATNIGAVGMSGNLALSSTATFGVKNGVSGLLNDVAKVTIASNLKLNLPITMVWKGYIISRPANYAVFGVNYNSNGDNPYECYCLRFNDSGNWGVSGNSGGSFIQVNTASTVGTSAGKLFMAGIFGATYQALYLNNLLAVSATNSFSNPTYTATSFMTVGDGNRVATELFYVFNRQLSPSEIQSLYVSPYQMISRPSQKSYNIISGAVTGSPQLMTLGVG